MNLKELYENTGGDYEGLLKRFGSEAGAERFLKLFLKDPSFSELQRAVGENDWGGAFRAAHTLKGVSGSLSLMRLYESVFTLTEAIRGGTPLDNLGLYENVRRDYEAVSAAIRQYLSEKR